MRNEQTGGFRLRPATPEDAEAIAIVQVRSFQAGFAEVHPPEALRALDPAPRVPRPSDEERAGEIYRLFVAPEYWGTGVAQALMRRACEQLRAAGFDEALLWVHADNPRARRFYEAEGWQYDGSEKDQESLGQPVRLLCYRTRLS